MLLGLRGMLHGVIRSTGRDPEALDPWFFPSPEDYEKVSGCRHGAPLCFNFANGIH